MKKIAKKITAMLLSMLMLAALLPGTAFATTYYPIVTIVPANHSELKPIVKVGDSVGGGTVTEIDGATIKVQCRMEGATGNTDKFRLPYANQLWDISNYSMDYISWGGQGNTRPSEGGSANLSSAGCSAYYYFRSVTPGNGGGSGSYLWTYTLNYDPNGGTGAPAADVYGTNSKYEASHDFKISSVAPTRDGYTFLGWADSRTAASAQYTAGSNYHMMQTASGYNGGSASKTVYAVWKEREPETVTQPYTIYKVFSGITDQEKIPDDFQMTYSISNNGTGYGSGTLLKSGAEVATVDGFAALVWKEQVTIPKGSNLSTVSITESGYTIEGYTWKSFNGSSSPTSTRQISGTGLAASDYLRNYYEKTSVTYTLHYVADPGTGAPADQTASTDTGSAEFTIPQTIPTRDGYTFLGWASGGDTVTYLPGDTVTITEDTTLTAVWKLAVPQVRFLGGSIRVPASYYEEHDYDTIIAEGGLDRTDLRFGYQFTLPEGVTPQDIHVTWNWGLNKDQLDRVKTANNFSVVEGRENTYRSNLVITNIPLDTDYGTEIYVKVTVTYTDAEGTEQTVTLEPQVQSRSVQYVARAVQAEVNSGDLSELERVRTYVGHLLKKMNDTDF